MTLTPFPPVSALFPQQATQVGEHPADAGVVELAGDGGIHRHVGVRGLERHAVALPLLAHVAQRVLGAAAVVLVEHDQLGVVEHVDFLELAGRAVVGGHHVHREIDQIDNFRIALADAGGLHNHQIEIQRGEEADAVTQHGVDRRVLASGGHRAHIDARAAQRVHADAVAQQRAAGAATGGIDRDHRDVHVREAGQEAVEQFVGHRRLAGTAGAGDADHRGLAAGQLPLLAQVGQFRFVERGLLDRREHAADLDLVVEAEMGVRVDFPTALTGTRQSGNGKSTLTPISVARGFGAAHHVLDHRHQPHVHAVVGVVDALDAVGLQLADFLRRDGAAAAGEHADVRGVALLQHVHHVLQVFDVAALVGRQRDGVGVFLQGRAHHVLHTAVVAQVDHFRALRLDQPAHDVDGGVVAVEQAGGGDEAQRGGLDLRGRQVGGRGTHDA